MWLLTCTNQGGQSYRLTSEKDHFVSRIAGDIILSGDRSVSREHAVIKFTSIKEDSNDCGVTITDLGSKYGTYINESVKLDPNKPYLLKTGDVIKFGCQWNEWRFESKPLVVVTSTLPPELKVTLKEVISELGGKLVNDWQEACSYLTMTSILLTAKVVCALASAVPIVTPEYWTSFQEALEQKKLPPDHNDFIPPLKENVLNKNKVSFAVNEKRRTIFSGKTFVFSTQMLMKKYKAIVSAAGGNSVTLTDYELDGEELCKPDFIFMQDAVNDESHPQSMQLYSSILKLLKSKGSRPIPESEIGLAILMCSLDIYCNPQYNVVKNVLQGGSMVNLSQLKEEEVWAADTPSVVGDITNVKMEETLEEKSLVGSAFSVPESNSSASLSQDSDGHTMRICEEVTLPVEKVSLNYRSSSKSGPEDKLQVIPENLASRKRIASSDSTEPAAKKVSSERENSKKELTSAHLCFEEFNFTDLQALRTSITSDVISQNKPKHSDASLNESAKRKHDGNGESPSFEQPSKKNCREAACSPKQNISDGSETIATTSASNQSLVAPKEQILQRDIRSASKSIESCSSLDHQLKKRSKMVEEPIKELESRSIPKQQTSVTCKGSLLRQIQSEDGGCTSRANGTSPKVMGAQTDDIPSTSKGVEHNGIPYTQKQSTARKIDKAEGRRAKYGGFGLDMLIRMRDLVIETPAPPATFSDVSSHPVNFKKFKKVRPQISSDALPEIIGESDLVPYKES